VLKYVDIEGGIYIINGAIRSKNAWRHDEASLVFSKFTK